MASGNATACSTSAGLNKLMKEWREAIKYLPRVDRAGLMRRCGSVPFLTGTAKYGGRCCDFSDR